jgi:sugar lactone lactonase YvrE
LAFDGGISRAFAQASTRIEQLAPELDKIIATSEPIKELATGFGGPLGPAEGPLWWKEGGFLLFTDIHNSRRMKHMPGQAPTVDLEPSNRANGLTRDQQGRLLSCEHDTRRVTRRELDGSLTVLANSFQGRRLNRPNDVVVKSDGAIYFTDPWSSPAAPEQWDLTFAGVYRLTPDLGTLSLLVDNFVFPNGLAFTPDESVLYVNDSRRGHIRAFDVLPNGTLAKQSDRVRRPARQRARRARRHESRCRRQCVLRRRRRNLDPRSPGQEARPHRARTPRDHQHRLRRRRLEDLVLHQPHPSGFGQPEGRGPAGAGAEENRLSRASVAHLTFLSVLAASPS